MKLMTAILLALTLILVPATAQTNTTRLSFGEIKTKVLHGPDVDGDIWFAVKVEVQNTGTKEKEVEITLRGLDAEGFEVVDVRLKGKLKAGQKKEMTESSYTNEKSFKTIVKWEVEE